jgi:hypothetical protein
MTILSSLCCIISMRLVKISRCLPCCRTRSILLIFLALFFCLGGSSWEGSRRTPALMPRPETRSFVLPFVGQTRSRSCCRVFFVFQHNVSGGMQVMTRAVGDTYYIHSENMSSIKLVHRGCMLWTSLIRCSVYQRNSNRGIRNSQKKYNLGYRILSDIGRP